MADSKVARNYVIAQTRRAQDMGRTGAETGNAKQVARARRLGARAQKLGQGIARTPSGQFKSDVTELVTSIVAGIYKGGTGADDMAQLATMLSEINRQRNSPQRTQLLRKLNKVRATLANRGLTGQLDESMSGEVAEAMQDAGMYLKSLIIKHPGHEDQSVHGHRDGASEMPDKMPEATHEAAAMAWSAQAGKISDADMQAGLKDAFVETEDIGGRWTPGGRFDPPEVVGGRTEHVLDQQEVAAHVNQLARQMGVGDDVTRTVVKDKSGKTRYNEDSFGGLVMKDPEVQAWISDNTDKEAGGPTLNGTEPADMKDFGNVLKQAMQRTFKENSQYLWEGDN